MKESELTVLAAPFAYQGGKERLRSQIADLLWPLLGDDRRFVDVCCGAGSVSLELIERGLDPTRVTMVDLGVVGDLWRMVGSGEFDVDMMRTVFGYVPKGLQDVHGFVHALSRRPVPTDDAKVYIYVVLQAAAFGSKVIYERDGRWCNATFRSYWIPTATSNRRSPVNPMMPMPPTIIKRLALVAERCRGVTGLRIDVGDLDVDALEGAVVYVDPPYTGTTGYHASFDVVAFAERVAAAGSICCVSEGRRLSNDAMQIEGTRSKGGDQRRTA